MSISAEETILGNYRVGKSIGEGTFGKVKLGTHIITQEKVAIKTLQKEKIIEQSDIERVTREICILKILRHPNIIQLYQIIETKTDIHLIMEYAQGGQLFDYIVKNKRLSQTEAINFMQQILAGVQYIHKNGIVHRDLKPQNLLLDHNKNIKIVDFGLSNQYKPGQKLKTACGSPCYAAPQMIAGKRYECLNVDIWSCGIILYAMLCGYLPFQDPNTNKLYRKIINGDFQIPKILSPDAKQILKNILNTNPEKRFKITQIRQSKWYNIVKNKYQAKGIIVGKDNIQPNEQIIGMISKFNIDPVQARTYVINNRHNHVTSLYYLMEIKLLRQGKLNKNATIFNASTAGAIIRNNIAPKTQRTKQDAFSEKYIGFEKAPKDTLIEQRQQKLKEQRQQKQKSDIEQKSKVQVRTKQPRSSQVSRRQDSPLIYRPDKKNQHYVPYIKKSTKQHSQQKNANNDSLNVSNIISSLVEANKSKLIKNNNNVVQNKKNDRFDKLQEFKLFPNKKNSSIYEPSSASKISTSRSKANQKSLDYGRGSLNHERSFEQDINGVKISKFETNSTKNQYNRQKRQNTSRSQYEKPHLHGIQTPGNKKRQELSDQLRQISLKIDQEIMQLRKQNQIQPANDTPAHNMSQSYNPYNLNSQNKSKDSINSSHNSYNYGIHSASNRKRNENNSFHQNMSGSKQLYTTNQSISNNSNGKIQTPQSAQSGIRTSRNRDSINNNNSFVQQNNSRNRQSQPQQSSMKVHNGPFNAQCIFAEQPVLLMEKMTQYLEENHIRYLIKELYTISINSDEKISIEAIHGLRGVYLIKFSRNINRYLNEAIIEKLSR